MKEKIGKNQEKLAKTGKRLRTFSIGMEGSPDVYYAKIVANHIGSIHTNISILKIGRLNSSERMYCL